MSTALTITKSKEDSKLIIKNLPGEMRVECDKLFSFTKDADASRSQANKAESPLRQSLFRLSTNDEAIKKAGFKNFGLFAEAVFGMSPSAASNAVKVAEKFDMGDYSPMVEWYSFFQLYELRDVPRDTIDKDVENGALHPHMTTEELRAYNKAHKLADGKPEVVKLYDGMLTVLNSDATYSTTPFYAQSLDDIRSLIAGENGNVDNIASFNPNATMTRDKDTVKGKGMFYYSASRIAFATYFLCKQSKAVKVPENFVDAVEYLTPEQKQALLEKLMAK